MSSWSTYLARGAPQVIYHMCNSEVFKNSTADGGLYFPPAYTSDGFIHATAVPSALLEVGNHFYTNEKGEWICICLNPMMLDAEVKYEPAAPVGEIEAAISKDCPLFPHIYGGIPLKAVIKVYKIVRNENGQFSSIAGLC